MMNFMNSSTMITKATIVGRPPSILTSKRSTISTLIERLIADMLHLRWRVTTTMSI